MITFRDVESPPQSPNQEELEYPNWWSRERLFLYLRTAHLDGWWNYFICLLVLAAIVWVIIEIQDPFIKVIDMGYNIIYGVHVASIVYSTAIHFNKYDMSFEAILRLLMDFVSFLHYAMSIGEAKHFKIFCYYLRFNRPFKYLWALNDYQSQGSVAGTVLKYCYLFFVLRISWALVWFYIFEEEHVLGVAHQFLSAVSLINTMFIPIGPSDNPDNDVERIICMLVMLTGCLVVTGVAVASLSLVISIYLNPDEAFRQRYRLIMKEMKVSKVPSSLGEKVKTFYKMYWHKQKAVSATQLLPTFPPTLPNAIYTDIYFEATQKNRVLRDLSYEFLSKVAMKMDTVLYIPGDTIIKRTTKKSNMIFIAYGDIEMLTAEDDSTAVLRMTCGTSLSGCAGAMPAACVRAYVDIRAATFCITHVISARDLWLLALKHVRYQAQSGVILSSFYEHLDHVKTHYWLKIPEEAKFKSSIYHFKRKLMALNESTDERGNYVLGRKDVFLEIAGSYIMRKRADATLTNESDAICLRPTFPCILQPASSLQIAWHSFISCVIIVVCFTHPYYLVFKKEVPVEFRFFDYVVTLLFVLDLIVHLSTGENVEAGVPITFAQTASQQVRDRWFIFDVVGTVPIFEFIANGHFAGINKLLRLPKAFRMLKTLEEICVYHSSVLRYLYYTLVLLIACYLLAALQQGFMCFHFGHCLVGNFTHKPFWENKTLDRDTEKYDFIFGLYWAISMITFTAHKQAWMENNWNTTVYTMFVLELCIVLRIFIEAAYSADIMVTTALREDYDACIANVKNFLVRNSVDPELRQRFINYLQLCWFTDKAYSMTKKKSSIFHDLPPHVYQDIVVRQRSKYLLSMPFMKLLNQEDLKTVSSKAKLFYTSPNEVLLNTGDISNEMYVIKQGMCEILDPDTKQVVGTLGVKDHFGVVECLLRLPAYYTVRAVTHLQIFSISNKVLSRAMELPRIKDAIEFAKERPEYSRLLRARESFQSYVPPAPAPNIEGFRRPRKYETDYEYLRPFYRLGSFSTLRYIFPRFTIRPDGAYLMRYERFRAVCALLSALVYPGYTYLKMQWPALSHVALLLDCTAYFDMVQRMFVGYFNEVGALVFHPASTAAHYMRGAFIVDLFACLPLEKLESSEWLTWEIGSNVAVIHMTPARQILMLNRLLQLYRLPGAMHNLQGYIERRDILLVLKAMPLFMVLLNSMTSMMVFCSVHVLKVNGALVIKTFEDEGGSWLHLFGNTFRFNLTESPWNLHVATFFWVVYETTSTGFGCFNPSNATLIMVLFMGMIISATVVTYFAVRIISVRANVNKELAEYQQHMKDIVVYMRREDLPHNLRKEVMEYYEHNWDKTGGIDYTSVLKLCDQITLRTDAILHIYGPIFEKCPFLAECDISLLRIIGRAVRSVYYLRGMLLVDVDDVVKDLYIVGDGNVAVKEHANDSTTIAVLSTGSVFGNLENSPAVRYTSAIVAQSTVHVLQINADTFHRIISDFPQVAKDMRALQFEDDNFIMGTTPDGDLPVKGNRSSVLQSFTLRNHKNLSLFFEEKLFQTYLMVISLACVYADVYNAGFQCNTTSFIIFLYTLDFCFYLKILLYYGFPYLTRKLAYSKKSLIAIKQAYLKQEFKYDLISCLPIELIGLFLFDDYNWTVFSWLRLNRMFRMVTAYKCLVRNRERITFNLTFSTVFTVLIWFTLFTHITACLWYFIGMLEDNAKPKSSWIYKDSGESWCDSMYICSVYFVLTTFLQTGVGDIMPKNRTEVIFVSILQIVSTMLYMIYVGEFSNLIQFRSFRSFRYYCKYLELQEFLKNNRVSQNLVTIVNNYSIHLWRESRGMQVPYFLEAAPQSLRLRVMSAAYMTHLTQNPVFKNCEPAFLRQLVGCLRLYTYDEGLYVVRKTEITDSMYMIHSGRVSQLSHDRPFFTAFKCFGMEQGLFHDTPYPYSYITVTKSQVLTLRLGDWEDLLKHFPKCKRTIYKYFNGSDNDFPDEPTAQTASKEPDKNNDPNTTAINTNFSNEPGDMKVLREFNVSSPNINSTNSTVEDVTTTPNVTSLTRLTGSNLSRKESKIAFNTRLVSKSDSKDVNIQTVSKKDKSVEEGKQNVTTNQSNQSVQTLFSLPISIRGSEDIEVLTNSKPSLKEIIENKVKGILKKYKASGNYELTRVDSNDVNNLPKEEDETESTNTHPKDTALEDKKTKDETAALSDSKNIADIEYVPEVDLNPEKQQSTATIKDTTEDTYALVPYKEVKKSSQESRKTSFDDLKTQPGLRIRDDDNDTEKTEETRPEDQAGPSSAGISKKNITDGPDKI